MFDDSAVTARRTVAIKRNPAERHWQCCHCHCHGPLRLCHCQLKSNLSRKTSLICGWSLASPCELPLCLDRPNSARYKDHLDGQLTTILRSTMWGPPSSQVCPVCCACGPCGGSQINSWAALPVLTTSASGSGVNILPKKAS